MVKADVLAALDAARGKYISGQELAQQLGVSRTGKPSLPCGPTASRWRR